MPLGSFLTVTFGERSVSCVKATAMGPYSLLGILNAAKIQSFSVPEVRQGNLTLKSKQQNKFDALPY